MERRRDGFSPDRYIGWERHLSNYWGATILSYSWTWGHFFLGGLKFSSTNSSYFPTMTSCEVLVTQSCPSLCSSMDCNLPGSSVHGILQARILKRGAIVFSRELSQSRDGIWVSCIAGRFFTLWATREVPSSVSDSIVCASKFSKFLLEVLSMSHGLETTSAINYHE